MKYYFVKGDFDWADEFNCKCFGVYSEKKYNLLLETAAKFFKDCPDEMYFGTNEALQYGTFSEWKGNLTIKSISEKEADTLFSLFKQKKSNRWFAWGTGSVALDISYFEERIKEYEENQDSSGEIKVDDK